EVLAETSISTSEIEEDLEQLDLEAKSIVISGEDNDTAVLRYDTVLSEEQINEMTEHFMQTYDVEPSISVVSPIVGEELVKNAIYALGIAAVGMLIYVTLRFEFFLSLTSIITLLHVVFIMLFIFSLFQILLDVISVSVFPAVARNVIDNKTA